MLDFIRGAVRPIVLLLAVLATIGFIAFSIAMPESWWTLVGAMIAYYFMRREQVPHG